MIFYNVCQAVSRLFQLIFINSLSLSLSGRYTSVGLQRYDSTFQSLFTTLVPPAIFVAVMAMQLRYFKPSLFAGQTTALANLDVSSFLPNFMRTALRNLDSLSWEEEEAEVGRVEVEEVVVQEEEEEGQKDSKSGGGDY